MKTIIILGPENEKAVIEKAIAKELGEERVHVMSDSYNK